EVHRIGRVIPEMADELLIRIQNRHTASSPPTSANPIRAPKDCYGNPLNWCRHPGSVGKTVPVRSAEAMKAARVDCPTIGGSSYPLGNGDLPPRQNVRGVAASASPAV